jgi:hypothetical protein
MEMLGLRTVDHIGSTLVAVFGFLISVPHTPDSIFKPELPPGTYERMNL